MGWEELEAALRRTRRQFAPLDAADPLAQLDESNDRFPPRAALISIELSFSPGASLGTKAPRHHKGDFETEAARLLVTAHNETQDVISDLAYKLTLASQAKDDSTPLPDSPTQLYVDEATVAPSVTASCFVVSDDQPSPENDLVACDFGHRLSTVVQLAAIFPYDFEALLPLTLITTDEALLRSVLADYAGQPDGLARAEEALLSYV